MFDEVAEKLFNLVIQKRQYGFYINNLKLFQIPNSMPIIAQPTTQLNVQFSSSTTVQPIATAAKDDSAAAATLNAVPAAAAIATGTTAISEPDKICDMRYYNELVNSIPAEYISTPIILHCMIEQVSSYKLKRLIEKSHLAKKNKTSTEN